MVTRQPHERKDRSSFRLRILTSIEWNRGKLVVFVPSTLTCQCMKMAGGTRLCKHNRYDLGSCFTLECTTPGQNVPYMKSGKGEIG